MIYGIDNKRVYGSIRIMDYRLIIVRIFLK